MAYRNSIQAGRKSNRQMRRDAEEAIRLGHRAVSILLACLAQNGGQIIVQHNTLLTVGRHIDELDYAIVDGKNPGESIVMLLTGENDGASEHGEGTDAPATDAASVAAAGLVDQPEGGGSGHVAEAAGNPGDAAVGVDQ